MPIPRIPVNPRILIKDLPATPMSGHRQVCSVTLGRSIKLTSSRQLEGRGAARAESRHLIYDSRVRLSDSSFEATLHPIRWTRSAEMLCDTVGSGVGRDSLARWRDLTLFPFQARHSPAFLPSMRVVPPPNFSSPSAHIRWLRNILFSAIIGKRCLDCQSPENHAVANTHHPFVDVQEVYSSDLKLCDRQS